MKEKLDEYCFEPNTNLVKFCKINKIPSICFPKGLKNNCKEFIDKVKPDAISIDHDIDPAWAKNNLTATCIQGGMNPKLLLKTKRLFLQKLRNT